MLVDSASDFKGDLVVRIIESIQKCLSDAPALPLRTKRRAQAALAELQDRQRKADKAKAASGAASINIAAIASDLLSKAIDASGGKIVVGEVPSASDEQLRAVIDSLKKREKSLGVLLGSTDGQKVTFVAAVTDDLIAKGLKAGDWVREAAKAAGGGGGGRPQMAQAGGKDPSKLAEALETARQVASRSLK
jgi:alanyl-tRNA synthetase